MCVCVCASGLSLLDFTRLNTWSQLWIQTSAQYESAWWLASHLNPINRRWPKFLVLPTQIFALLVYNCYSMNLHAAEWWNANSCSIASCRECMWIENIHIIERTICNKIFAIMLVHIMFGQWDGSPQRGPKTGMAAVIDSNALLIIMANYTYACRWCYIAFCSSSEQSEASLWAKQVINLHCHCFSTLNGQPVLIDCPYPTESKKPCI